MKSKRLKEIEKKYDTVKNKTIVIYIYILLYQIHKTNTHPIIHIKIRMNRSKKKENRM